jgi:hypothetical protein
MPFWLNHGGKFEKPSKKDKQRRRRRRGTQVLDHWSESREAIERLKLCYYPIVEKHYVT